MLPACSPGRSFLLLSLLFFALLSARGEDGLPSTRRVLFFSKSAGFEHSVIKRDGDKPSYVENILAKLGSENRFDFTFSKDGRIFTPENVARYDAFVFFTTGDLTKNTGDGNPAMTQEGKAALLDAIHQGKGFVGDAQCVGHLPHVRLTVPEQRRGHGPIYQDARWRVYHP